MSFPVSARTSHVLPWSMCPAVPTVSGISESLHEEQARVRVPEVVQLLERNEAARFVEAARPLVVRRPGRDGPSVFTWRYSTPRSRR